MSKIIEARLDTSPFMDNDELRYAHKHRKDGIKFTGWWQCDQFRNGNLIMGGPEAKPNTFTTEGMAFLLNTMFHDLSKAASNIWYVGIFKNNVTPSTSDTAAAALGSSGTYGECQDPADFDDATDGTTGASTGEKPGYTTVDTSTATVTNSAAQAQFTMAASITVYGAFLSNVASCSTPGSAKLMCAKKFSSSRAVIDGDILAVTVSITASTS
jgi:hypothetical protein